MKLYRLSFITLAAYAFTAVVCWLKHGFTFDGIAWTGGIIAGPMLLLAGIHAGGYIVLGSLSGLLWLTVSWLIAQEKPSSGNGAVAVWCVVLMLWMLFGLLSVSSLYGSGLA